MKYNLKNIQFGFWRIIFLTINFFLKILDIHYASIKFLNTWVNVIT